MSDSLKQGQVEPPLSDEEVEARRKAAAVRALQEAELRRQQEKPAVLPKEVGAKRQAEPTRYGDWEKKGIASDF